MSTAHIRGVMFNTWSVNEVGGIGQPRFEGDQSVDTLPRRRPSLPAFLVFN
jgi:hypothetical protein